MEFCYRELKDRTCVYQGPRTKIKSKNEKQILKLKNL